MNFSVKKGDYVKVIAGNKDNKGKIVQIVAIDKDNARATIEGKDIQVVKKAVKARRANDKSGIVTVPTTIAISNLMPVCAACGKATRVRSGEVDGKKVRICASCGAELVTKKVATKDEKKTTVRKRTKKAEAPVEAKVEE